METVMSLWHEFHGPNAGYVIEAYERYRQDPNSVDDATRQFFRQLDPALLEDWLRSAPTAPPTERAIPTPTATAGLDPAKVAGVINLAHAIRWYGHFAARLDPLGSPPPGDPALELETYGLTEDDLRQIPPHLVG